MTVSVSFANEYQYLQGTEAITLYRKIADGQFDSGTAVAKAFTPTALGEAVNYKAKDTNNFLIWQSQTGNPSPKVGDVIQDGSGARWTCIKVETQAFGARFACDVVKER